MASIVAHAAEGPLWYAADLTGDSGDDGTFEIRVRPGAEPVRLPGGAEQGGFGGGKSADKAVYAAVSQALAGPATWSLFPPVTSLACWAGRPQAGLVPAGRWSLRRVPMLRSGGPGRG